MFKGSTRPVNVQRLLVICGITGPVLFVVVLIILGSLEPNYSHLSQTISELGAVDAKYNLVMNTAGFSLLGLLLIAFAIGLDRDIGTSRFSRLGPALLVLSGLVSIMLGIFHCDPDSLEVTTTGKIHTAFVVVGVITMALALLAISYRLWGDDRWRSYVVYTLWTMLMMLIIAAIYRFGVFESWKGALERILLAVPLLWIEVMAIRLLRLS